MAVGTPYRAATAVADTHNNATVAVTTNVNVSAGDTLFLMVLNRLGAAAVVTSISGATASEIVSFKHPTTTMGVSIVRIYAAAQINSGTTITCTLDNSSSRKVLHAWAVPGLADANVDTTNGGGASGTTGASVASGNTGTTSQADAIAIYADGYASLAGTDAFTPAAGYTEMDDSLAGASSWPNLETAYKILAATGTQQATATHTGTTNNNWVSLLGVWKGVAAAPTVAIGKITGPLAIRGLAFTKLMAVGHIGSPGAVRGLSFAKLLALGKIASAKAIRGLALSLITGIIVALGKIPSPSTVRGLSFTKLMAVAKVLGPRAIRGLLILRPITVGKIVGSRTVRGLSFTKLMAVANVLGPRAIRGLLLLRPMAVAKIPSASAVRGLSFAKLLAIGKMLGARTVRGLAFTKLMAGLGKIPGIRAIRGLILSTPPVPYWTYVVLSRCYPQAVEGRAATPSKLGRSATVAVEARATTVVVVAESYPTAQEVR